MAKIAIMCCSCILWVIGMMAHMPHVIFIPVVGCMLCNYQLFDLFCCDRRKTVILGQCYFL